jgi:hypothetical protein
MKARQASEVAAQKAVWRQLAAEHEKVWSDYRETFAFKEAEQENAGQQQSHRDEFWEAASGATQAAAKPEHERRADQNQGNGADRSPTTENQLGGTGAPDDRRRNAKPVELTQNETEAMMTAAVADSATGTSRIERQHARRPCSPATTSSMR